MRVRESLRLQARFLLAMGIALDASAIAGCHGSAASPDTAPTTTATIPAPTASSSSAGTIATSTAAATSDAALATTTPGQPVPIGPLHPQGMREVKLPDGGTAFRPMPFLGRPLRVEGEARVAKTSAREDWNGSTQPNLDLWTREERDALAIEWARDAAAEHASIAAFSRFSLQLLALGAPADLVEAAHEAALDEARHARDAYSLASAFAGEPIGPAPLDVHGALAHVADVTLARLAVETFEEGCVAETLAAMDAHEKHAKYTDSAIHDVLGRIAVDEERHAVLAWRTLAWAVRAGGDDVKRAIAKSLARLSASSAMSRNTVFSAVIVPCANALLDA